MDIVKIIKQHTENLHKGLSEASIEQRKSLVKAVLGFYFLLPDFNETINQQLKISVNQQQLINDIENDKLQEYRAAMEKANAEIDEYADDYEEPEAMEVFIVYGFSNAVADLQNAGNVVELFVGIINVLDYYENFSDSVVFWNSLLTKEVAYQSAILAELKEKPLFDSSIYKERYKNIVFGKL
jgi:hypothetical protein